MADDNLFKDEDGSQPVETAVSEPAVDDSEKKETPQGEGEPGGPGPEGEGKESGGDVKKEKSNEPADDTFGLDKSKGEPGESNQEIVFKDDVKPEDDSSKKPDELDPGKEEEKEKEKAAPPKGFVEIGALHEARAQNKAAKTEIDTLKAANESLLFELAQARENAVAPAEKEPEFKILSEQEEKGLREEDPEGWFNYKADLIEHREKVREIQRNKAKFDEAQRRSQRVVSEAATVVNEYLAEEGKVGSLINIGEKVGFTRSDLTALSQPQTVLVVTDQEGNEHRRYLGHGAVAFLKALDSSGTQDINAIREQVKAELTPVLTEQITKDLLSKVKTTSKANATLTGQGEKGIETDGVLPANLTEAQYARLSPAQQEAWLKKHG